MKRFPKTLICGAFVATYRGLVSRFKGDKLAQAHWTIKHEGVEVGSMTEGPSYGWGKPVCSLNALVWAGPLPDGHMSPRSQYFGAHFDTSPSDGYEAAMIKFAARAERLMRWRLDGSWVYEERPDLMEPVPLVREPARRAR